METAWQGKNDAGTEWCTRTDQVAWKVIEANAPLRLSVVHMLWRPVVPEFRGQKVRSEYAYEFIWLNPKNIYVCTFSIRVDFFTLKKVSSPVCYVQGTKISYFSAEISPTKKVTNEVREICPQIYMLRDIIIVFTTIRVSQMKGQQLSRSLFFFGRIRFELSAPGREHELWWYFRRRLA